MKTLTINEAMRAYEHAETVIRGCESIDELDVASDYSVAIANCPSDFTEAQRTLAQSIILRAFEKAIGRA
jgi:hypothetical protein